MVYELFYIVPARFTEDEVDEIKNKAQGILEKAGSRVLEHTALGKQKLAYSVNKSKFGHEFLVNFEVEQQAVGAIRRELDLTETISRYILSKRLEGARPLKFEVRKRITREEERAKAPVKAPAPTRVLTEKELEKEIEKALEEPIM